MWSVCVLPHIVFLKAPGRLLQSTSYFKTNCRFHSVIAFPFCSFFLLLLKIKNTESCFSSRSTVLEIHLGVNACSALLSAVGPSKHIYIILNVL
uniref:Uncharacterized protein n=1 Tax=Poecilia reticulata TaxID=8081 RepID=A0A3P9Q4U0_POERE